MVEVKENLAWPIRDPQFLRHKVIYILCLPELLSSQKHSRTFSKIALEYLRLSNSPLISTIQTIQLHTRAILYHRQL